MPVRCAVWRFAGQNCIYAPYTVAAQDAPRGVVRVTSRFIIPSEPACDGVLTYTITQAGVLVELQFQPDGRLPELPEVGVCFETAASYESLTYLGRGPQENYSDRQAAADIGLYNIPIDEMYVPYLRPQENGARTDVRFASLQGEKRSLRIESVEETPFTLSVCRWSPEELEAATHERICRRAVGSLCVYWHGRQGSVGIIVGARSHKSSIGSPAAGRINCALH